jgi:hypothetical protein
MVDPSKRDERVTGQAVAATGGLYIAALQSLGRSNPASLEATRFGLFRARSTLSHFVFFLPSLAPQNLILPNEACHNHVQSPRPTAIRSAPGGHKQTISPSGVVGASGSRERVLLGLHAQHQHITSPAICSTSRSIHAYVVL